MCDLDVSGVPGIGKTLCVKKVAQEVCLSYKASYIYTNALTVKRPIDIFKVIHYEMTKQKLESNEALYQLGKVHIMQITTLRRISRWTDSTSSRACASTIKMS